MPKYLLEVTYTATGVKGVIKDGGSKRRAAAQKAIKSLGGKMEAFYFAFGSTDVIVIAPDCGLKYLPREVAFGKMCAMVEGARIVRKELERNQ